MPKELLYSLQLRQKDCFHNVTETVFALADCNEQGHLTKKFVIVERLSKNIHVCSCDLDKRAELIAACDTNMSESATGTMNCIHIQEVRKLTDDESSVSQSNEQNHIFRLTDTLLVSYCDSSQTYGVLAEAPRSMKCLTCTVKVTTCPHMKSYKHYAMDEGFDPLAKKATDIFTCISSRVIEYPLPDIDTTKFSNYASGFEQYPTHLVPPFDPKDICSHGHSFQDGDPISESWVANKKVYVHLKHVSMEAKLYYRPSNGKCSCKLDYDGRNDLLLNLNGKHLFSYAWLFDILHDTQETRYPLAAAFRSACRTRAVCGGNPLPDSCYDLLRHAYNCFLRLLDLDFSELFECSKCGTDVDCVIMDGIMMGSRKDLVPDYNSPLADLPLIDECSISDRVFLTNVTARKKLASYAALERGHYSACQMLSSRDFKDLLLSLKDTPSLQKLVSEAGRKCPQSHQRLLGELSRGSPTCGIVQLPNFGEFVNSRKLLEAASQGHFEDIKASTDLLKRTCPMLHDILNAEDISKETLASFLTDLLISLNAPFKGYVPENSNYGEPSSVNSRLEFFPNYPLLRGKGNYAADKSRTALSTGCRKDTLHHASLTPGLFTMFCPHGICLGFQLMDQAESPRTAFDIFIRRFEKVPKLLIYDNACKLHLYCLKREPVRFANTRFMVDRLHFRKGHIGCSLGYSMDSYDSDESIATTNSQTNEQANASLRRLASQLTYMPPYNVIKHTSVFLALRNIDKMLSQQ
jgi:hypothetical protein